MLGGRIDYELVWTSIYTFQCRRMERFRHGRVLFAGDSAHQVSPFGARGANSGIQDIDNLGWKLELVLKGIAPDALLDSYDTERVQAADENILNSTRSTDFITPKSKTSKAFRNAVLDLAGQAPFARSLVNSGRLSVPCVHDSSPLNGPDDANLPARTRPGAPAADAPLGNGWLLKALGGGFKLLAIDADAPDAVDAHGVRAEILHLSAAGNDRLRERHLGDAASAVVLVRPDPHVAARWKTYNAEAVQTALGRAMAIA